MQLRIPLKTLNGTHLVLTFPHRIVSRSIQSVCHGTHLSMYILKKCIIIKMARLHMDDPPIESIRNNEHAQF